MGQLEGGGVVAGRLVQSEERSLVGAAPCRQALKTFRKREIAIVHRRDRRNSWNSVRTSSERLADQSAFAREGWSPIYGATGGNHFERRNVHN